MSLLRDAEGDNEGSYRSIELLFNPRSVAIVGASKNPASFSTIVAQRLAERRGDIAVYPINPNASVILDRPTVPSIDDLDAEVDVALIFVASHRSLAALSDCVRAGIRSVVLYAAVQHDYRAFNKEALDRIRGTATRVLGPNSLGLANIGNGALLTYGYLPEPPVGHGQGLAVVGHSGAVLQGIALHAAELGCGVEYLASLGNEADLGLEDFMAYFLERDNVKVIVCYLEQIRDPQAFILLAKHARALGKKIVVLRAGSTEAGREVASSHTGAIVGSAEHELAFMAELGVHLVHSTREAAVVASALRVDVRHGGGLAALTTSGGFGTIIADLAGAGGIELAPLDRKTKEELGAALQATSVVNPDITNPIDLGVAGAQDRNLFKRTVELLLTQPSVAALLVQTPASRRDAAEFVVEEGRRCDKPVVLTTYLRDQADFHDIASGGVPVFGSEDEAVLAVGAILRYADDPKPGDPSELETSVRSPDPRRIPNSVLQNPIEPELKHWLSDNGLDTPNGHTVHSRVEAMRAIEDLRPPVVLKVIAPGVAHKTDVGGVELGITNASEMATAWSRIGERLGHHRVESPSAFLVEEQIGPSTSEWLVGIRNDFGFGPVVVFGFGGLLAEAFPQPLIFPVPLDDIRTRQALGAYQPWQLLQRRNVISSEATHLMSELLVTVGELALANWDFVRELDLNPVVIAEGRPVVLDAHLGPARDQGGSA